MVCPRGCIITLAAFVWLFSAVYFQMSLQIHFLRGHIFTYSLVVHVLLLSIICWNNYITFFQIFCKILIHFWHHQKGVVSCGALILNWEMIHVDFCWKDGNWKWIPSVLSKYAKNTFWINVFAHDDELMTIMMMMTMMTRFKLNGVPLLSWIPCLRPH